MQEIYVIDDVESDSANSFHVHCVVLAIRTITIVYLKSVQENYVNRS